MVAAPYFLLALGIVLVVLGAIQGNLPGRPERRRRPLGPRMRDAEIARRLNESEPMSAADFVVLAGLACVAVSVLWRLLRPFF